MNTVPTHVPLVPGEMPVSPAKAAPALVAIDRDEARVFPCLAPGTAPVIVLVDASGDASLRAPAGEQSFVPDHTHFEAIAQALGNSGSIQVVGRGPDASPSLKAFLAWVRTCYPTIAARIASTSLHPDRFCTNNRLLTTARNFLDRQSYLLAPG